MLIHGLLVLPTLSDDLCLVIAYALERGKRVVTIDEVLLCESLVISIFVEKKYDFSIFSFIYFLLFWQMSLKNDIMSKF